MVLAFTAPYADLIKSGTFELDDGRVLKLTYHGNQHDASKLIAAIKNGNVILANIGRPAQVLGRGLSGVSLILTVAEYQSGGISRSRAAFRLGATLATIAVGTVSAPGAVLVAGGALGAEILYDRSVEFANDLRRRYPTPESRVHGLGDVLDVPTRWLNWGQ